MSSTSTLLVQFERLLPPAARTAPVLRAARHLGLLAVVAGASAPTLAILYMWLGDQRAAMVVLGGGLAMAAAPLALRAGLGMAAATQLFIGALYLIKVWLALHLGGLAAPTLAWFLLCPAIAALLGSVRAALAWAAVVSVTVLAIFALELAGGRLAPHPVENQLVLELASVLCLLALSTIIALLARERSDE